MLNILAENTSLWKRIYLVVCWIIQHNVHFERVQRRIVHENSLKYFWVFFLRCPPFMRFFS